MKLVINGIKVSSLGRLWRMAPASIDATIAVGQKPGVEVDEKELTSVPDVLSVPPFSVDIYSYAVQ